jgi:predicted alpha/beta-hydrolase family hydrolase
LAALFEIMRADHDGAQGTGHSRTVLAMTFDRITRPHGYSLADLAGIDAPTLIDVGDRDPFCTVDDAVKAYSALPHGELAVHPDTSHLIASNAVQTLIDFGAPARQPTDLSSNPKRRRTKRVIAAGQRPICPGA